MKNSFKKELEQHMLDTDERPNYAIEELSHNLDAAVALVYPNWTVESDGWNQVIIRDNKIGSSVIVRKHTRTLGMLVVKLHSGLCCDFETSIKAEPNVVDFILWPMIQNYLLGERSEVVEAVKPLLEISPVK